MSARPNRRPGLRVLVVTNMYPSEGSPDWGTFVWDQVESLRAENVEVDVLAIDGRRSRWAYATAFTRLWRQLHTTEYDLLHAHHVLAGAVARAQFGLPVVLTQHGLIEVSLSPWQRLLSRIVEPLVDEVVYVSEHVRAAAYDPDGWVIPCGIDLRRFAPIPRAQARALLSLDPARRLILFVGDPSRPEKGHALAQEAFAWAARSLPDLGLIVLSGRPHDEVPAFMSACDALLLPSTTEGSPTVVKEALACNLPVVATPVGDVQALVAGVDGCAIARATAEDLALHLVDVLRTPRRIAGREHVTRFGVELVARQILDVYAHAIGSAAGNARGR